MTESPRSGVKKGWPTKGSARRNALEQPTNSMRNPAWKHGMDKTDKIWQRETPLWAHHPRKYIMIAGANRNCCRGPTVDGFALRNYCRGPPNSSIDYSACGARHSPPPPLGRPLPSISCSLAGPSMRLSWEPRQTCHEHPKQKIIVLRDSLGKWEKWLLRTRRKDPRPDKGPIPEATWIDGTDKGRRCVYTKGNNQTTVNTIVKTHAMDRKLGYKCIHPITCKGEQKIDRSHHVFRAQLLN